MSSTMRPGAVLAAVVTALALLLTGCAPATTEGSGADGGRETQTAVPSPTETGSTDGEEDPEQDRVRTGPVAQYGGPAYGDQGEAEVVETGVWCKTIAVFWGGDEPIPDGVRFTFDAAVPDQPGLETESGVCGTRGADRSCLGMAVEANESGIFCSVVVRPGADFVEGTTISFEGTLECPTAEICDAVAARQVEPGPPLVVNTPEGA
ncbi:hypothetical protein [Microbacterium sp. HJ5]